MIKIRLRQADYTHRWAEKYTTGLWLIIGFMDDNLISEKIMLATSLHLMLLVFGIATAVIGFLHALAPLKAQMHFYKTSASESVGNMFVGH